MKNIDRTYELARERYATLGTDTDAALSKLDAIPISLHCWQGDDVTGFEPNAGGASGGILSTGNHPGRARNPEELRADLELAFSLIPGPKRLNLHAIYAENTGKAGRDELTPEHFSNWMQWAQKEHCSLDFNGTFFSHPMAAKGFTLSSQDKGVREFWIRHAQCCRMIGEEMGRAQRGACVTNLWIPDGFKDNPADRFSARARLKDSLDEIFAVRRDHSFLLDAVESKLFGIGAESCTVGSHEFYLAYALANNLLLCLDAGHFHPTEVISDKISSVLIFLDEILLHVSRPVRWDSDHVVILDDELRAIAREIVGNGFEKRVHIGLDYFDGTINRIAAWVIGTRNMEKALLQALLEPKNLLRDAENAENNTKRLVYSEELKSLPFGAVWDYYCEQRGVPAGEEWFAPVCAYESEVLAKRN